MGIFLNQNAFNEVSIMRQTHQAAKITIRINDIERMKELICDGVLVSTAAGVLLIIFQLMVVLFRLIQTY